MKYTTINLFFTYCDASEPWQLGLQDPATPVFEGMIFFHNYLVFFLIIIGDKFLGVNKCPI